MLTKHLPASTLHKLLPKLGVRTRAADSKDLLSMLNIELPASSRGEQSSFFIGMMAEQPATAQLVEPRVASRLTPSSSFRQHSQEEVPTLPTSQRCVSIFRWSLFLMGSFAMCGTLCYQTALSIPSFVASCLTSASFSFALTQSVYSSNGFFA